MVDGGNFDWEANPARQPLLNQPDPSYHGAVWTQAVKGIGPVAYIIKMRVTLLRDIGAAMSPFNAFMFIQGLETLPLRMRQHCANAARVAEYLSRHPKVSRTIYPGLMTGELRRRAVLMPELPKLLEGVTRVPGTAVFLVSHRGYVPTALLRNLDELRRLKPDKLVRRRAEKFLRMGQVEE